MTKTKNIAIIGGGAAGFFAAVNLRLLDPLNAVVIFEAQMKALGKVKVSGGGRCNLTNNCFDLKAFSQNYPRGEKFMRQALYQFGPKQTMDWFQSRGVDLKVEKDNRVFPVSNSSQSVIECLQSEAQRLSIQRITGCKIVNIKKIDDKFVLVDKQSQEYVFNAVVFATGSSPEGFELLQQLHHPVTPRVPSLFTFKIENDLRLHEMSGVAFENTQVKLLNLDKNIEFSGPLLITHWGMSGPAILKLSAWGAALLHDKAYLGDVKVNFLPDFNAESLYKFFLEQKKLLALQKISNLKMESMARRFWVNMLDYLKIDKDMPWQEVANKVLRRLAEELTMGVYKISGKGVFKDEFVTCGGVPLDSVHNATLESKSVANLYFAGEVLDIDGITGGFNLQNAWTTGYIVAKALSVD